jgi:hypothetical protein
MFQLLDIEKKPQEGTKLEDSELMPAPSVSLPRVVPTTPVEAKVPVLPSPREEAMSEKAAHHRILRSSDSANKRVPSSLFAAAPTEAVNERKRKGDARNTIGGGEEHENNHPGAGGHTAARKRNYSLQGGGEEVENSHPAARQRGARNRSLQGEARSKRTSTEPQARVPVRPSTVAGLRAASASAAASKTGAGSRVTRPQAPAASSNKTRGWVR